MGLCQLQNGLNYEKHVVSELSKWVPTSRGFADLGANGGIHTIIAKSINPDLPIVCAEASPVNRDILLRNIARNKLINALVLPFPLSDCNAIIRTNLHDHNTSCSVDGLPDSEDYPRLSAALAWDSIVIPYYIDLVKIDVEGFEIRVLNGASKLMQNRPRIIFEFCPEITHRSGLSPEQTLQWFFDRGYKLTMLDYQPGMRKECANPTDFMEQLKKTAVWITDCIAEPI